MKLESFLTVWLGALYLGLAACSAASDASGLDEGARPALASKAEPSSNMPASAAPKAIQAQPVALTYDILDTYPHDPSAFTQGLFFHQGVLYESTGRYGQSSLRKTEINTGRVLQKTDIPEQYFGEGITLWNDQIIYLTWRAGRGFIFGLENFELRASFPYPGQGWGLTANTTHLIQSDGSHILRFLDPETLAIVDTLEVRYKGRPLSKLNELEWIEGMIWANVWQSDMIFRIDPRTGKVTGEVDLAALHPAALRASPTDHVLNGIAYDPAQGIVYVTGKYWPRLFALNIEGLGTPLQDVSKKLATPP